MVRIIENAFYFYTDFPDDVNLLIEFTKKSLTTEPDYFHPVTKNIELITLPYLKKYTNSIQLFHTNSHIYITMGNDTLSYPFSGPFIFNPCNIERLIEGEPVEYYKFYKRFMNGRFFDENGIPVIKTEYLSSELIRAKKTLQQTSLTDETLQTYMYEGKIVPLYHVLEYKKARDFFYFVTVNHLYPLFPFIKK